MALMVLGVIPARYGSSRFPGKVLAMLKGKPMVQWVWERASKARRLDRLLVAADDRRVAEAARRFGAEAVMTPSVLASGTDRAWAAARRTRAEIILNIQGDEPLLDPRMIDRLVEALARDRSAQMATLRFRMTRKEEYRNPNVVKVVTDAEGWALYFSRSPIPCFRSDQNSQFAIRDSKLNFSWHKHLGLYAYRRSMLKRFVGWKPSSLEKAERLEQLRALEHGIRIKVVDSPVNTIGVDTPKDLVRVARLLK